MKKYKFILQVGLVIKAASKKKALQYKDDIIDGWENADYDFCGDAKFVGEGGPEVKVIIMEQEVK